MKIAVGRKHRQVVTDAKLREQGVDRADLNAGAAAAVTKFRCIDMIAPVGNQKRQGREAIEDAFAGSRPGKPLQQLLQYETGGEELFAGLYRSKKLARLRRGRRRIPPKSERPDAGIDKEAQRRERSAL